MKFRLESDLYKVATAAREREWRLALDDLNADLEPSPARATLGRESNGSVCIAFSEDQRPAKDIVLHKERLRRHFRDYRRIIERLARVGHGAASVRQLEALDYAKKLVHDEAGETMQRLVSEQLSLEHKTARRLFTLVFLVANELPEPLVNQHRHAP